MRQVYSFACLSIALHNRQTARRVCLDRFVGQRNTQAGSRLSALTGAFVSMILLTAISETVQWNRPLWHPEAGVFRNDTLRGRPSTSVILIWDRNIFLQCLPVSPRIPKDKLWDTASASADPTSPPLESKFAEDWLNLMNQYSQCKFNFGRDRLTALDGMATDNMVVRSKTPMLLGRGRAPGCLS